MPPVTSIASARLTDDGSAIVVYRSGPSCPSARSNLLYGDLPAVGSYGLWGAECSIVFLGGHEWLDVPASDLYFLVVGSDDTGVYESSWGLDGAGAERNGTAPSNFCDTTNKVATESCP